MAKKSRSKLPGCQGKAAGSFGGIITLVVEESKYLSVDGSENHFIARPLAGGRSTMFAIKSLMAAMFVLLSATVSPAADRNHAETIDLVLGDLEKMYHVDSKSFLMLDGISPDDFGAKNTRLPGLTWPPWKGCA